jgi:hypothetical protein
MTANEIANSIDKYLDSILYDAIHPIEEELNQAITMLRQQAKEIESLKNAKRFIQNFAEEQHQRAAALEMRELSDEEIMEIYDRVELYNIDEGQMYLKPIEFAKELLKKAREK